MQVLIIGGTSSLAIILKPMLSDFAEVLTAGRTDCDIHLDLANCAEPIKLPAGIDVVINTAASFGVKSASDLVTAEIVNVLGVLKLCEASSNAKIKHLVLISSIFADLHDESAFYNVYSLSKKHADELAELYRSSFKLPITILRPSQFYGSGKHQRKHQPFLSRIIDNVALGNDVIIYGTHDPLRNFIHVEDVAKIITLVVQQNLQGTYTCMNMQNVSYSEVAHAAIQAFESKSKVIFQNDKPNIPNNIFAFDDSLYRHLNYYPQISILDGMRKEASFRLRV